MKLKELFNKIRPRSPKELQEEFENMNLNEFRLKRTWYIGFLSFLGFPSLVNMLQGKDYSTLMLLTLFALVFFIPERHKHSHLVITPEELDYYRKNPEEISMINNATKIRYKYLTYAFILGFILVVVSKIVGPMFTKLITSFWSEVMRDLLFEVGVALWGGAITTYIIELHSKKEEEDCKRKQDMLRKLLDLDE